MDKKTKAKFIYKELDELLNQMINNDTEEYLKPFKDEDWFDTAMKYQPHMIKSMMELLNQYKKKYIEIIKTYYFIEESTLEKIQKYIKELLNKEDKGNITNKNLDRELDELEEDMEDELIEYYRYNMKTITTEAAAEISRGASLSYSFSMMDEVTREYLEHKSIKWANQVSETTNKRVKELLVKGYEEGLGSYDLAMLIEDDGVFGYSRAETIARTEVITANRYTEYLMYTMNDEIYGKKWSSTGGPRTRLSHAMADGQVKKIDEPFIVDGEKLLYPGDSSLGASAKNVINCRCAVMYLTKEEYKELI